MSPAAAISMQPMKKIRTLRTMRPTIGFSPVGRQAIDAPEVLEPTMAALDDVAALIGLLVMPNALVAI
jgi:hypothetical protein